MEKVLHLYRSFEAAEIAAIEQDMRLTPEERIQVLLRLQQQVYPDATEQRLVRVCRLTQLEQS